MARRVEGLRKSILSYRSSLRLKTANQLRNSRAHKRLPSPFAHGPCRARHPILWLHQRRGPQLLEASKHRLQQLKRALIGRFLSGSLEPEALN